MQSKVSEFHKTITNKDAALRSLTNCRSVLEKRIERLVKEKEELIQQRNHLQHKIKKRSISVDTSEEQETQLAMALSEAESLKEEKEMMAKDMKDLKDEMEARKVEVRIK